MITIEHAANGWILHNKDDAIQPSVVELSDAESEAAGIQRLTYAFWEVLGYYGSKHDPERCFIEIRQGDGAALRKRSERS